MPKEFSFTLLLFAISIYREKLLDQDVLTKTTKKEKQIVYSFDAEAQKLYNSIFTECRNISNQMNGIDVFIRFVVSFDTTFIYIKYLIFIYT